MGELKGPEDSSGWPVGDLTEHLPDVLATLQESLHDSLKEMFRRVRAATPTGAFKPLPDMQLESGVVLMGWNLRGFEPRREGPNTVIRQLIDGYESADRQNYALRQWVSQEPVDPTPLEGRVSRNVVTLHSIDFSRSKGPSYIRHDRIFYDARDGQELSAGDVIAKGLKFSDPDQVIFDAVTTGFNPTYSALIEYDRWKLLDDFFGTIDPYD